MENETPKKITLKNLSKDNWVANVGQNKTEDIMLGATLRIADAAEKMAENHSQLLHDLARYKRWYQEERETTQLLNNRIRGLKGAITRIKNIKQWKTRN